ncbi:MAG: NAD-dependent epimerase/dehydratase family protein [Chloroflexi bacterium]|nr:NAD-dependent epimerase/dehydratase family protein [Chloroflexota bacterium]
MRVLITGGAGFIGSALAHAHVARGDSVVVVDSLITGRRDAVPAGAHFCQVDVAGPALEEVFASFGPFDLVSHHAALKDVRRALIDPRGDAEANIVGTLNVLRCAAQDGTGRYIFASSAAIYGDAAMLPTPESAPIAPISPYGISKAAAEAYCAYFARSRGLHAVALRYGSVYGPAAAEETEAGVITIFARRMLARKRPVIYGDGEQTRDLVFVDDVVRANLLAADSAPRPWAVYNVATGVETSINETYALLAVLTEYDAPPEYQPPKPGEVRRNALDPTHISEQLGWTPTAALRDGLAQVVAAYLAEAAPVAAVAGSR